MVEIIFVFILIFESPPDLSPPKTMTYSDCERWAEYQSSWIDHNKYAYPLALGYCMRELME